MKLRKRTQETLQWSITTAVVMFLLVNFMVRQQQAEPDPLMVSDDVIMYNADHFVIKPHPDTTTIVIEITFIKQ